MKQRKLMKWKLREMKIPERIGYAERDAMEYLKSSRKGKLQNQPMVFDKL